MNAKKKYSYIRKNPSFINSQKYLKFRDNKNIIKIKKNCLNSFVFLCLCKQHAK